MTYRIVQRTTGNVGKRSVRAVASNPALELVGCSAWSPDKVDRDVGELSGIEPLGVAATDDVDVLLALKPDCVIYNPVWPDIDEPVRILVAGVNIVTTAAFITGHYLGDGRERIVEACERGGSTIFGSGINPGFAQLMAVMSATICDRIDKITGTESGDSTLYDSPATEAPAGFGQPIDHPTLQEMTAKGTGVFRDALLDDGRRARHRARRCALRSRIRPDHRGSRPTRRLEDRERLCRWNRRAGEVSSAVAMSSRSACGGARAKP